MGGASQRRLNERLGRREGSVPSALYKMARNLFRMRLIVPQGLLRITELRAF
jgi:hypothetical protein